MMVLLWKSKSFKNRDMAGTWWEIPGWKLSRPAALSCKTPSLLLLGTMWPILLLILSDVSWSLTLTHGSQCCISDIWDLFQLLAPLAASLRPLQMSNIPFYHPPSSIIHQHPHLLFDQHLLPTLQVLLLAHCNSQPSLDWWPPTPKQSRSTCTSICRFMSRRPIWHMDLLDTFGLWKKKR